MKYYIAVEEVRSKVIEVDAENEDEAIRKVEDAYYENTICLDDVDCINDGTCFYDETNYWMPCIKDGYETHFQKIK